MLHPLTRKKPPEPGYVLTQKLPRRAADPLQFGVGLSEGCPRVGQSHRGRDRVGLGLFSLPSRGLTFALLGLSRRRLRDASTVEVGFEVSDPGVDVADVDSID
jgi:hypothetical protein